MTAAIEGRADAGGVVRVLIVVDDHQMFAGDRELGVLAIAVRDGLIDSG